MPSLQISVQWLHRCVQWLHTFFRLHPFRVYLCSRLKQLTPGTPSAGHPPSRGAWGVYMNRKETEQKKKLARTLYLAGKEQQEIAETVGVSRVTISKWCTSEGWKETRAAANITRPELVNKLLLTINNLLEEVNKSDDPTVLASLPDRLTKLAAAVEKLEKKASIVDVIEVFMAFSKWLEYRAQTDPEVTPELMKTINRFQDLYITEQMGIK